MGPANVLIRHYPPIGDAVFIISKQNLKLICKIHKMGHLQTPKDWWLPRKPGIKHL